MIREVEGNVFPLIKSSVEITYFLMQNKYKNILHTIRALINLEINGFFV